MLILVKIFCKSNKKPVNPNTANVLAPPMCAGQKKPRALVSLCLSIPLPPKARLKLNFAAPNMCITCVRMKRVYNKYIITQLSLCLVSIISTWTRPRWLVACDVNAAAPPRWLVACDVTAAAPLQLVSSLNHPLPLGRPPRWGIWRATLSRQRETILSLYDWRGEGGGHIFSYISGHPLGAAKFNFSLAF